jgi:hypothetical protein
MPVPKFTCCDAFSQTGEPFELAPIISINNGKVQSSELGFSILYTAPPNSI